MLLGEARVQAFPVLQWFQPYRGRDDDAGHSIGVHHRLGVVAFEVDKLGVIGAVHDIDRLHETLVVAPVHDRPGTGRTTGEEPAERRLHRRRIHPQL